MCPRRLGAFPFASSTTLDAQALRHQGRQPVVPAAAAAAAVPAAAVAVITAASSSTAAVPAPLPQPTAPRRPPPPAKPKVKEKIPDPDVDLGMFGLEFTVKKPPRMPPRPPNAAVAAGSTGQPPAVSQNTAEPTTKAS